MDSTGAASSSTPPSAAAAPTSDVPGGATPNDSVTSEAPPNDVVADRAAPILEGTTSARIDTTARVSPVPPDHKSTGLESKDKFARSGHLAVGIERFMGYFLSRGDAKLSRGAHYFHLEEKNTFISVLSPTNSEYGAEVAGIPRATADYFVTDELAVGASMGYATHGGEFEVRSNFETSGGDEYDEFHQYVAGARVGYTSLLVEGLGLWPRIGYYYSRWSHAEASGGAKSFGALHTMNLEALLMLLPSSSWGVQAGVVVDVSIAGSQTDVGTLQRLQFDVSRRTIGVTAGLTGLL